MHSRDQSADTIGDTKKFTLLTQSDRTAGSGPDPTTDGMLTTLEGLEIPGVGVVLKNSTSQGVRFSESMTFVPNVKIINDSNYGAMLVPIDQEPII